MADPLRGDHHVLLLLWPGYSRADIFLANGALKVGCFCQQLVGRLQVDAATILLYGNYGPVMAAAPALHHDDALDIIG